MKNLTLFKVLFFLAFLGLFCFTVVFVYYIYDVNKRDNLSKELATTYSISYLYSDSPSYNTNLSSSASSKSNELFVIGIIKIDKLKLNYPILSESSEELLEIAADLPGHCLMRLEIYVLQVTIILIILSLLKLAA